MYDDIDRQYEEHLKGMAADSLEKHILDISMNFELEELMDLLDRMKVRFTYLYEKEQERRNALSKSKM